jgi:hypothetical protein
MFTAKFVLVITIYMPLSTDVYLERVSKYIYTGVNAQVQCEQERLENLRTKPQPGDRITVSECTEQ